MNNFDVELFGEIVEHLTMWCRKVAQSDIADSIAEVFELPAEESAMYAQRFCELFPVLSEEELKAAVHGICSAHDSEFAVNLTEVENYLGLNYESNLRKACQVRNACRKAMEGEQS